MAGPLGAIGLSRQEEDAYELLVPVGPSSDTDLEVLWSPLTTTRGEVQQLLSHMQARGLVTLIPEDPPRYVAAPIRAALDPLANARERELAGARERIERLAEVEAASPRESHQQGLVEVLTGRAVISARVREIIRSSTSEVRALSKPPFSSPTGTPYPEELETLNRERRVLGVYDVRCLEDPLFSQEIDECVEAGENARILSSIPLKMVISDDRVAILPLNMTSVVDSALIVHKCALLDALVALFESCWESAVPLQSARDSAETSDSAERGANALSHVERRMLSLMFAGLPDSRIAGLLQVSHRTLERRVKSLYERVGARSRFDFAIRAYERGWLSGGMP